MRCWPISSSTSRDSGRYYFTALALFVLGLLTKTVTATLPAALLVIFWWQRGHLSWKRDVLPLVPFFVLGAVAGLVTAWVERKLIGAEGADFELTFLQRGLLAGRVIWFYFGKLVWPANLMFIYPRWEIDPSEWWQWLFPIATLAVTVALWAVRAQVARHRWRVGCCLSARCFPCSGFLNVYPVHLFVRGRSLSVPGQPGNDRARRRGNHTRTREHAPVASCRRVHVSVAALAVLTWRQSQTYANSLTLYQETFNRNPDSWMVTTTWPWS